MSIVIPAYNMSEFMAECLDSATNQTYQNLEIVVVDDASSEPTHAIAEKAAAKDSRIRVYCNDENVGGAENTCRAVELSTGPLVKLLNSDDILDRNCVAMMVAALGERPSVVMAFCRVEYVDRSSRPVQPQPNLHGQDEEWNGKVLGELTLTTENSIGAQTALLVKRAAFESAMRSGREWMAGLPAKRLMPGCMPPVEKLWHLAILSQGDAVYLARCLAKVRVHRANQTSLIFSDPVWTAALSDLIDWSRDSGYLPDPVSEAQAWMAYIARIVDTRPYMSDDDEAGLVRLLEAASHALERLDAIARAIGADSVAASLDRRLVDLWKQRHVMTEMIRIYEKG